MKEIKNSSNSIRDFFARLWDILFNWIASIGTLFFGVVGIFFEEMLPQSVNIKQVFFSMGVLFVAFCWKFTIDTRKKLKGANDKIDELKRTVETNNVTADNFFITRKEKDKDEDFASVVNSKPKSIYYSGGNLNNLISEMMESQCYKQYIINNKDVKVRFLFPDPNIDYVIDNLVDNITLGNKKETYIADIKNATDKLFAFISINKLESQIEFRFYKVVPSFGLKIIAGGNNERLYVDLYTIKVEKENRYQFRIEKTNSQNSYLLFEKQYDELWNISNKKTVS
jgi:hypothetical protein